MKRFLLNIFFYLRTGFISSVPFIIIGDRLNAQMIRFFSFFIFWILFARRRYWNVSIRKKTKGFMMNFVLPYGIYALMSFLAFFLVPAQFFNMEFLPLRFIEFVNDVSTLESIVWVHFINGVTALIFTMIGTRKKLQWIATHIDEEDIPEWAKEIHQKTDKE